MLDTLAADAPAEFLPTILQAAAGPELTAALPLLDECGHPDAPRLVALLGGVPEPLPAPGPAATYQLKVQLRYVTKPPVWRRLRLPAGITLDRLHEVVQAAMGWQNYHMHVFSHESGEYGVRDPELGYRDERKVSLSQLLTAPGDKIVYTYDFGDGWEHDIVLEDILPPEVTAPVCVTGKGACPPEDCGGSWGYADLKHTLADPNAENHKNMLEWLDLTSGDEFDPKHFSPEEANQRLRH
ncbi:plasmid pRiA4b ORF-3 family protein [Actinomadura sp. GC306]|nr:plasmid pRiA4b ORF-3 family protein [Actinomadura sp. GC306]